MKHRAASLRQLYLASPKATVCCARSRVNKSLVYNRDLLFNLFT